MGIKKIRIIFLISLSILFQACTFDKTDIKSVAQTNSANQIENYKNEILKSLINYKKKLDLRNPNAYNKEIQSSINHQIMLNQNYINLIQNGKKLETYNEYFYYAFSKEKINNRNDLLIIGLYKLVFKAFSMDKEHQFSAVQYSQYDMLKLYEYLQVVRWKIRTAKDENGEYLFNTWQNNWQLELAKRYKGDYNIINNLAYISQNKESIYDHSNFTFEIVLSKILTNVEHSLKKINIEPYEMGVSALKSFIFII
jgi:hypothetical protein